MRNKVTLIGLDGATFELLNPLMKKGIIPNLEFIKNNGAYGNLASTLPPYTATAWVSMITGQNPGKHGVFGFLNWDKDFSKKTYVSSRAIKSAKVWNLLNQYKKKVGIINFPISYPVEEVEGFMISGFITPKNADKVCHPESLWKEIFEQIGDYVINVKLPEKISNETEALDFIDKVIYATQKRSEALFYLMKKYDPDFVMVIFMSPDKIQHEFFKYVSGDFPLKKDTQLHKRLLDCYRQLDKIIGEIINSMNKSNGTIIMISDHGFAPLKKRFFLNLWLEREGFLKINRTKLLTNKVFKKSGLLRTKLNLHGGIIPEGIQRFLDWSKTKAWAGYPSEQAIYINLRGREKDGVITPGQEYEDIRSDIISKLRKVKDPEINEIILKGIFKREEVYSGPFEKYAPDILIEPNTGWIISDNIRPFSNKYVYNDSSPKGCHQKDGIFIAYGNNIQKGKVSDAEIADIAPTVLSLMNVPVLENMDGKVLLEIFEKAFINSHPIRLIKLKDIPFSDQKTVYQEGEEREIEKELKSLGYF